MKFRSVRQLKDHIRNREKSLSLPENTLLNYYTMERFLYRMSKSRYGENFVLKGGFLISSMIGIDLRSTMDIDVTIKGLPLSEDSIREIIKVIISEDASDNINWKIIKIRSIQEDDEYENFRVTLEANFFNLRSYIKIDITTGDIIVPKEIVYNYQTIFNGEKIMVKAYPIYTILAEKLESILVRNITNTRGRDFYDIYILLKLNSSIDGRRLYEALYEKAKERNTISFLENRDRYLNAIKNSEELMDIWEAYRHKFSYAKEISRDRITDSLDILREIHA